MMKFAKLLQKIILTQVWFGVLLKIIAKAHVTSKNGYVRINWDWKYHQE
jgi:hypothetical protein